MSDQKVVKRRFVSTSDARRAVIVVIIAAAFALAAIEGAQAQALYGSIVGTVTDTSGAVVPGATITVTQTETNETRSSVTNSSGDYVVSTVPAGVYTVAISKAGFQILETRNINVTINTMVRVDGQLTIGAQTQTVTVTSSTAALQTDRTDVHGVVSSSELQQLPQPTRTYEGLVGLLPGVAPPTPGFAGGGGTNNPARSMIINVNGTSASGTNVSIDGVSATNAWVQFYSTAVPSTEAAETVNVVTASSAADQGVVNGGSIRVQIKSGTNSFHGSAYGYFENSALKARPYFFPVDTRKPKYIDNDLGGTLGGPIVKDKLFFFASYEGDFCERHPATSTPCPLLRWSAVSWHRRRQFSIQRREILTAVEERPFPKMLLGTMSFRATVLIRFQPCSCPIFPRVYRMEYMRTTFTSTRRIPTTCKRSTPKSIGIPLPS